MAHETEHSAYPHPGEFEVMRPEYSELEDGYCRASITVAPFHVSGESRTEPGARRAALYEAEKTYHSYHPEYRAHNPFPGEFTDRDGMAWFRVPRENRKALGDYRFIDEYGEEDYADIESMLTWDVRPAND